MKRILSVVVIALLMTLAYVAGRLHTARNGTASTSARHVLYWVDPMHPDYKSDHAGIAPDCGMQLEPIYAEPASSADVQTSPMRPGTVGIDLERHQLFGIQLAVAEKSSGADKVRVLGRVVADDTKVYRVDAGTEGFVRETYRDSIGELVKKDQKLATSYVGDALAVASGFLAATAVVQGVPSVKDGSRTMPFPGAVSKQGFSSIQGYTDRLRNLGVSGAQIKEIDENRQLPETVNVVAPVDGFILSRNISVGQHFDRSTEFYRIADLSRVWILADILGSEAQTFRPGTIARVTVGDGGKTFSASVSNVLPQVDPVTRTLKLRLEADNPGFALRPDMFVDVELPVSMPAGLTVPVDAVIDSGSEQRVFVRQANGVFEPRKVQVGWRSGDRVEIVQGLSEGERVVASGTFIVDSESPLKSQQGASKGEPHKGTVPPKSNGTAPVVVSDGKVKDAARTSATSSQLKRSADKQVF
jgi:membrane fusion protein, copper/silver efflux system